METAIVLAEILSCPGQNPFMLPLEPSASLVYGAYLSQKVKDLGPHVLTQTQQARVQVSTASLYVTIREAVTSRAFSGSRKQVTGCLV